MDYKLKNDLSDKRVWLSLGKFILSSLVIIILSAPPVVSHAGILSLLSDLFTSQPVSAQSEMVIEATSQNMPLPEPAINLDPVMKTETDMTIDGGEALLPEVGPSNDVPENSNTSNGQISVYIVRSGDTLAEIAEMFDVSVNTILWANDIKKSSSIRVGQTLVILPITGVMHTVVSGDTLSTIAKKYGGDVEEIANFNDLDVGANISIGDTILIPDGQASSSIRPSTVSGSTGSRTISSASGPDYGSYYIKPFVSGRRTQGLHGYNAVDYGMSVGSSIYASAVGTVIISKNSGWNGGYGNYVAIRHPNKTQTIYAHLSNTVVSVGQSVTQGQLIGYSGNTGKSTGPHLHFEIRGAKNPF